MRNMFVVALLCLLFLSLAAGQETKAPKTKTKTASASTSSAVGDEIKKLEQEWAQGVIKDGAGAIDKYEADDILSTDPTGRVTDKSQDKQDLSSGDLKFQSAEVNDLKVRVYGNTAVATGATTMKGSYKGQDISGTYRFTDTWVKRNGKWQAVASQATKVQQ